MLVKLVEVLLIQLLLLLLKCLLLTLEGRSMVQVDAREAASTMCCAGGIGRSCAVGCTRTRLLFVLDNFVRLVE